MDASFSYVIYGLGGLLELAMFLWVIFDLLIPLLGGENYWRQWFE